MEQGQGDEDHHHEGKKKKEGDTRSFPPITKDVFLHLSLDEEKEERAWSHAKKKKYIYSDPRGPISYSRALLAQSRLSTAQEGSTDK